MSEQKELPLRLMFDTNIYDKLDGDPETQEMVDILVNKNKLKLLKTHIQEDELSAKPNVDDFKEQKLPTEGFILGVSRLGEAKLGDGKPLERDGIEKEEKVPTAGAVFGFSKWGECTYGDGSQSGISINDVKTEHGNRLEDALIATTASQHADILVTEDKRLLRRLKKISICCKVFSFDELKELLKDLFENS